MRTRLVCLAIMVAAWTTTPSAFHFELLKSTPAAKAALTGSPARLQLWFSQVPAAGVSQVTLANEKGDVALGKTVIVAKDKSMYADPVRPLGAGRYTIHWRGAGDDGHVQQGDIVFTVSAK
jgi:methionine-rich copper-binding protein CopC